MAALQILCYGDSHMADSRSLGRRPATYADSLQTSLQTRGHDHKVSSSSLSGVTAHTMVRKVNHAAILDGTGRPHKGLALRLLDKPDLVIIMAGASDLAEGFSPEDTLRRVAELHEVCHELGIATIAVAPPVERHGHLRQTRDRFARLLQRWSRLKAGCCSKTGCVAQYIDAEHSLPKSRGNYWESDGLHFSPAGAREFGRVLTSALAPTLREMARDKSFQGEEAESSTSWVRSVLKVAVSKV
mmetsp:Transcript_63264/g.150894  ORF Transcript_63264/g.150894 Transcript_63264/m.150894 type:complete len:243 (+) Transcript_63264:119-847(+)